MPALPVYPASDLDRPSQLLAALGSFWFNVYEGRELVTDILKARASAVRQAFADLQEIADSLSRHSIPVYHKQDWARLDLFESQMNSVTVSPLRYDAGGLYDGTQQYDVPLRRADFAFPVRADLRNCQVIFNTPATAGVSLSADIDFILDPLNGVIAFRTNPFTDPRFSPQPVFQGTVVDHTIELWLFCGDYENNQIYIQFGSVLGVQQPSTDSYRRMLNAVFDSLVQGTAREQVQNFMSAVTGIPLAQADETVELVTQDAVGQLVVTDKNAYRFSLAAVPIVSVGNKVATGQALTDGLIIYELNRGLVPADLPALAIGRGLLAEGYYQDLVFENKTVPTVVTTDADGFTELQFEIGGFPADVEAFWASVQAAGKAAGQTFAQLLDTRTNKVGEPTEAVLPTTINPLQFLISNVLRHNAFVVKVRPEASNSDALSFDNLRLIHKMLPPQTTMIVLIELTASEGPFLPSQTPTATAPGIIESLSTFLGMPMLNETVSPSLISERSLVRSMAGRCQ